MAAPPRPGGVGRGGGRGTVTAATAPAAPSSPRGSSGGRKDGRANQRCACCEAGERRCPVRGAAVGEAGRRGRFESRGTPSASVRRLPPCPAPPGRAAACGARQAPPPRGAAGSRGRRRGKLPIRPSGRAAGVGRGVPAGCEPRGGTAKGWERPGGRRARGCWGLPARWKRLSVPWRSPALVQGLPLTQVTHRRWSSEGNVAAAAPAYCGDGNDKNQVAGRGLNNDPRG